MAGDAVCKRRPLLLAKLGHLDLDPEPDPVPPAAVPSEEEQAAYERGRLSGGRTKLGLVARKLADVRDWAIISDPVARAYGRGCCAALEQWLAA
jgi:hypothetical protein